MLLLTAIACCCGAASCDSDVDMDYVLITLQVKVQNAKGENLLDYNTAGNVLGEKISLTYKGKEYELQDAFGRAVMPSFFGLVLRDDGIIEIGQFYGGGGHEECTLHIGNIDTDFSIEVKASGGDVKRKYYLNGVRSSQKGERPLLVVTL